MDAEKYLSENYNGFFDEFDITELQDIIQAMEDYSKEQLALHDVSNFVRQELERRVDLILNEPDGIVRETMIKNIPLDL